MRTINPNAVSLAGEFAVLSQLALRGYDANMTLGRTKSVDILVSDPKNEKMYKLEVKTNFRNTRKKPADSKIFGKILSEWIMGRKHEEVESSNLFYCFVNISKDTNLFKFYIVPNKVVAKYVKDEHAHWARVRKQKGKTATDTGMRMFRIGTQTEKYPISTPAAELYENNWNFSSSGSSKFVKR